MIAANTNSSPLRARRLLRQLDSELSARGAEIEIAISQFASHLYELLPEKLAHSWDVIVALGGDGTLFEVVNCCMRQPNFDSPLAMAPAGTANSFSMELPKLDPVSLADRIMCGNTRAVDLLRVHLEKPVAWHNHEFYCSNVTGLGFVSDVNVRAKPYKRMGMSAYALSVIITLVQLKTYHVRLEVDGQWRERECAFVEICNSRYTAGNMKIAPNANIEDGLIDVTLLKELSRVELLNAFPQVFSGSHIHHPKVECFRCRHLRVESEPEQIATPDGEVVGQTPLEVDVLPKRLRFIV